MEVPYLPTETPDEESEPDEEAAEETEQPETTDRNMEIEPVTYFSACIQKAMPIGKDCGANEKFKINSEFSWNGKNEGEETFALLKDTREQDGKVVFYKTDPKPVDKTDTFTAEYKKVNGYYILQSYKRNYKYNLAGYPNKIELEYPADFGDHASYSAMKINGKVLRDGDVMKVGKNGHLAAIHPAEFNKKDKNGKPFVQDNATIFMNGMNVDQRQLLDYAGYLNEAGGQDIYMIANIDKGLDKDLLDVDHHQKGLFIDNGRDLDSEKRELEDIKQSTSYWENRKKKADERIAYLIKHKSEVSDYVPKIVAANKDKVFAEEKIKEMIIETETQEKAILRNQRTKGKRNSINEASINSMIELLKMNKARNILSHSQGSENVALALADIGIDEQYQDQLLGVKWTSVGGAYSERNINELPMGLDVQLNYNHNDFVSTNSQLASERNRDLATQKRNILAEKRRRAGEKFSVRINRNHGQGCNNVADCAAHGFRNYNGAIADFFR